MLRRLLCFLGLHTWSYSLRDYGTVHLSGYWPPSTKCKHCSKKYYEQPEDIQCPVCGHYCLGKGGVGCIDKPSLQTTKRVKEQK